LGASPDRRADVRHAQLGDGVQEVGAGIQGQRRGFDAVIASFGDFDYFSPKNISAIFLKTGAMITLIFLA
jgi:hypothetical protein